MRRAHFVVGQLSQKLGGTPLERTCSPSDNLSV